MAQIDQLSVFFPAYNEQDNLKETVLKAKKVLEEVAEKWEIIIVDDGSKDKTPEVADSLAKSDKRIKVIHHNPNRGYGGAFKSGLYAAKYSWITFTDSDGQFDFSEITNFIDKQKETSADAVIGYYKKRQVSTAKILTSKLWEYLVFALFGLKVRDIDCGFKLISKKIVDSIAKLESERGAFISSEFLIKAKKKGYKIIEIPVTHYPRTMGQGTGRNFNVIIQSFRDLFSLWLKLVDKKTLLILVGILLLATVFRLYRISEYLTFLGDEGRDVIVVRKLLLYADPILVGPGTSIGNMYLGPLYYYFMAPWLWLFNYSPVGPAFGVAILAIATVFLVWVAAKDWFGKTAAWVAAVLYAISPVVIIYSRSSWNPNIMPFFALLTIYSIWKAWWGNSHKWLLVTALSFAFVMQSHYLGLLLLPVIGVFWLLTILKNRKSKTEVMSLVKQTLFSGIIFALLMSPLVIFDSRHEWRNFEALKKFFFERQTTVSIKPWNSIPKLVPLGEQILTSLMGAKNSVVGYTVLAVMLMPLFWLVKFFSQILKRKDLSAFLILYLWFGIALVGFGLYKQEIYDHYYGFIFAAPFLLFGGVCQWLVNKARIRGTSIVIVAVLILAIINLLDNPLIYSPNRQLQRTEEVANEIIKLANNETFNLAVIAERNYDDAYQYFLENKNAKMVDIDPQLADETITDQLFVVCELPAEKCDPTHSPKAEVAAFGWSKIDTQWEVAGTNLYKLVHSQ